MIAVAGDVTSCVTDDDTVAMGESVPYVNTFACTIQTSINLTIVFVNTRAFMSSSTDRTLPLKILLYGFISVQYFYNSNGSVNHIEVP